MSFWKLNILITKSAYYLEYKFMYRKKQAEYKYRNGSKEPSGHEYKVIYGNRTRK